MSGEDDVEWGMLPPAGAAAVQTVFEEGCSAASVCGVHPPTRRLVLVGGVSRSPNRFSLLTSAVKSRQRGMCAAQRCAQVEPQEFSQRSVSATVVECTASQNQFSQTQGRKFPATEEDQSMSERDHGDEVLDGTERDGASDGEEHEEVPFAAVEDPISGEVQAGNVSVGLQSLDEVDVREVFKRRAVVMKSVLPFMRGLYTEAMRLACKTVVQGRVQGNIDMETRGWKLFPLLPRMMLYRPPSWSHARGWSGESTSSFQVSGVFWWRKV